MRAIRIFVSGGPEALQVENERQPEVGSEDLLIDVEAVGVNFVEIYQREGQYPMSRPFTPGSEAAGTVRSIGTAVRDFKPGDRIVSQSVRGAYAERALVAADRAVRIPDGVSTVQAAAVFLQGMTAHYLACSTYPLQRGDRCLIHAAAGGVGLLFCQIAKHKRGAFVIGTASSEEKLALARENGMDEGIEYTKQDFAAEVRRITNGTGVPVVYDSVGKTTFEGSLNSLARRGMLVLFGQSSGPVRSFDPQILNRKGSLFLTRPTLNDYVATREELVWRAGEVFGWVADGSLHVRIHAELPLERAADAHRMLSGRQTTGKVVLTPQRRG